MMGSVGAQPILRLLNRVGVPNSGCLVVLAESYFDETNTHKGAERLCVAGYVFYKANAEQQAVRWAGLIDKWGIPYFHMVDCAHNTGVFAHLSEHDCDLAAREAIQIIKETAATGVCVTVLESDYLEIVPQLKFYGSAYDACARDVITGVSSWIDDTGFKGSMYYYFEAGTDTESKASWSILQMMKEPEMNKWACYAAHSFVRKICSPGVQAADILAWHAGQDCKRALSGKPMRKDFASLCDLPHRVVHINRKMLEEVRDIINSELAKSEMTNDIANAVYEAERRLPKNKR